MDLKVRLLTPLFGAEIIGVDLSEPLSDEVFQEVRRIWLDHKVVVFRDQKIDEEDLIAFTNKLGELEIHVRREFHSKGHPEVMVISNVKENGKAIGVLGDAEAPWHIDQIYMPFPTFGTMVYGVEVPPEGGNTWFCDLATAYETLPADLKHAIEGRSAVNSIEYFNRMNNMETTEEQRRRAPDVLHPLVRKHPYLGRKALFFSPGHTMRIDGLPEAESRRILSALTEHATRREFLYEHAWRVGDAVMWDNTCTMHRRDPFASHYRRLMKRTSFMLPPELRAPR